MKHVTFHLPSFLRRVRIHGGEFDSSARAMNRVKEKGSLMTYKRAFLAQADLRIVRGSTIERKQMSTKTTFKRVALVAVAALGLGVLSVAPSNAAAQLDSLAVSLASTTQVTAETLTATSSVLTATLAGTKGVDTLTVTASIVSGPAYVQPVLAFKESTTAVASTTADSSVQTVTPNDTSTITQATAKYNVYLKAPSVVGAYVVKITPTGGVNAAAVTVTITVTAPVVASISATYSTIAMASSACSAGGGQWSYGACYSNGGSGASAYVYSTATDTVTASATISSALLPADALIASFLLDQKNGASNTMASTVPWTVAITSGPGKISMGGRLVSAKSVTESLLTTGVDGYQAAGTTKSAYLVSDGVTGVTVITFTAGGVLIGTRTITVYGPATTLVATAATAPTLYSPTAGQTSNTGTYTVTAKDSNAAAATVPSGLTVKSSDTSVATVTISQPTVTVTGVKAGTATITVTDPATSGAATAVTFTVTVAPTKPTSVDITFDAASYNVGDLVTMTVAANMGDSATANLFTSTGIVLSATAVASGTAVPTNGVHAIVGGKATYKFYAPAVAGSLVVTATTGASVDVTTAVVLSKTVPIANPGVDAATDAANEAIDAANAATDAALAAAEAADAATTAAQEASDAVAALSESVTKLIAGLQAQIKSLAAVVAKIAKKVKA